MPYKTIDLCAGIGGIRRGFEMTGAFILARLSRYVFNNPEFGVCSCGVVTGDVLLSGFCLNVFNFCVKRLVALIILLFPYQVLSEDFVISG